MKEILFRGKRLDNKTWVYGWYCEEAFGRWPLKPCIIPSELAINGEIRHEAVDLSTVGQFTGLKDKHRVKIFEGDIIQFKDFEGFDIHAVVKIGKYEQDASGGEYGGEPCCGVFYKIVDFTRPDWAEEDGNNPNQYEEESSLLSNSIDGGIEIIGNVYDNPDLAN